MVNFKEQDQQEIVISYLTLRKFLGFLGILLPLSLVIGTWVMNCNIQPSISAYYYSPMRDWFVGILCAMAIFFFSYTGYKENPQIILTENRLTNFAGILALIVALIPTLGSLNINQLCSTHRCPIPTSSHILSRNLNCDSQFFAGIHIVSAALFFIILAYILYFKFVNIKNPQNRKKEIKFYRTCGIIMFVCIAAMIINYALEELLKHSYPFYGSAMLFWLESVALWAFGVAWLMKGKAHEDLKDFKSFLEGKASFNKK